MEVSADSRYALAHRSFGDAVLRRGGGHGLALHVGIAECEVETIDGEAGVSLAANVADNAATEF